MIIDLADYIREALRDCAGQGRPLPFIISVIGLNASMVLARVRDADADPEYLAEHREKDGFGIPAAIVVMDATGSVSVSHITADDVKRPVMQ
jgi:hypothetical protein